MNFQNGGKSLGVVLTPFNMELRSRHLAEVEVGDPDPGVPGPSPLETEGSEILHLLNKVFMKVPKTVPLNSNILATSRFRIGFVGFTVSRVTVSVSVLVYRPMTTSLSCMSKIIS